MFDIELLSFASNISMSIVNKDVKLASLSLNSDQHQFLPYNISALLREKGVRINKIITKGKRF